MEKGKKKEKPTPKLCACGEVAAVVRTRAGKMISCPDPMSCCGNFRTTWRKSEDQAIAEWNSLIDSHYAKLQQRRK